MVRIILAVGLLVLAGLGCVSSTPPERPFSLPRDDYVRRPTQPPPSPPHLSPQRGPARQVTPPPRFAETWYPRNSRLSNRWTTIVIHHSATDKGGASTFDRHHRQRGWDELGYHFVIGNGSDTPDGMVEIGSRWHSQKHGAHCKTPNNYYNDHGIGICLVGDFTRHRPTRKQMESLTRLVRFLSHSCRISPDRVTTHGAINHKTQCPGQHFAIGSLRRALSASVSADAPQAAPYAQLRH